MTNEQLEKAQWKLAHRVADIRRADKSLSYDQVFNQEFPREETGIDGDLMEETRHTVGSMMCTFKRKKAARQSTSEPKDWQLVAARPGRQLSLLDMRSYPD